MNQAQREYLMQYCRYHGISEDEAMEHALVKDVFEQLKNKADTPRPSVAEMPVKCNCS